MKFTKNLHNILLDASDLTLNKLSKNSTVSFVWLMRNRRITNYTNTNTNTNAINSISKIKLLNSQKNIYIYKYQKLQGSHQKES